MWGVGDLGRCFFPKETLCTMPWVPSLFFLIKLRKLVTKIQTLWINGWILLWLLGSHFFRASRPQTVKFAQQNQKFQRICQLQFNLNWSMMAMPHRNHAIKLCYIAKLFCKNFVQKQWAFHDCWCCWDRLSNSCKGISRQKKGFENIYIPKKRKMDKEEKEVDKQEEFNAKEEVDLKKE